MVVQKAALKAEMTAEKRAVNAEKIKIEVINLIVNMVRIVDVIKSHQKEKLLGVIQAYLASGLQCRLSRRLHRRMRRGSAHWFLRRL